MAHTASWATPLLVSLTILQGTTANTTTQDLTSVQTTLGMETTSALETISVSDTQTPSTVQTQTPSTVQKFSATTMEALTSTDSVPETTDQLQNTTTSNSSPSTTEGTPSFTTTPAAGDNDSSLDGGSTNTTESTASMPTSDIATSTSTIRPHLKRTQSGGLSEPVIAGVVVAAGALGGLTLFTLVLICKSRQKDRETEADRAEDDVPSVRMKIHVAEPGSDDLMAIALYRREIKSLRRQADSCGTPVTLRTSAGTLDSRTSAESQFHDKDADNDTATGSGTDKIISSDTEGKQRSSSGKSRDSCDKGDRSESRPRDTGEETVCGDADRKSSASSAASQGEAETDPPEELDTCTPEPGCKDGDAEWLFSDKM